MSEIVSVGSVAKAGSKHIWKIENFSAIKIEQSTVIHSPVFSTIYSDGKTLKWRLRVYPNGFDKGCRGYMSVYLINANNIEVSTTFSITVMADSNTKVVKSYVKRELKKVGVIGCGQGWARFEDEPFVMENGKVRALPNDTLTISCSITSPDIIDPLEVKQQYDDIEKTKFRNHYARLFETGDLSDVTFSIGNKSLKLHKAILGGLSSVFYSMFSGNENEANNVNQVTITSDVKFEVMRELFRYVYAREVENIENIADDLYVVADKYQIEGLKALCDETLYCYLNDDNALPRLDLALKYDMVKLKPVVIGFVGKKLKYFLKKEQFKQLSPAGKDLFLDIVANKLEDEL